VRTPPTLKRTHQPRGPSQKRVGNPCDSARRAGFGPAATDSGTRLALGPPHALPDDTCDIREGRGPTLRRPVTTWVQETPHACTSSRLPKARRAGRGPCVRTVTSPAPRPTCTHSYNHSEVREMGGGPREGLGGAREAIVWRGAAGPAGAEREKGGPTNLGPSSARLRGAGPRAPLAPTPMDQYGERGITPGNAGTRGHMWGPGMARKGQTARVGGVGGLATGRGQAWHVPGAPPSPPPHIPSIQICT
jgi:hypothetical protein